MSAPAIQVFPDRTTLMLAAADRMAAALYQGIGARGRACAALSGGTTPAEAYSALAKHQLDWPLIAFALVDERFVPPEDAASNEGLLRRTLAPALAAGAQLAPMYRPGALADAALRADRAYAHLEIDVALMGMGEDAHTASWFPGATAEALASTRRVIAVSAPQAAGSSERLTLTLAALKPVAHIVLLLTGRDKRARLEAAFAQTPDAAPIAALFGGAVATPEILWAP